MIDFKSYYMNCFKYHNIKKDKLFSKKTITIALAVIVFILVQLFVAPRIRLYSLHRFTAHYQVYQLIVPTIACFMCGMALGLLLNIPNRWSIKKCDCKVVSGLAILLGTASIIVSVLGIVEVITDSFPSYLIMIHRILISRFLSVIFIRIMPFLSGGLLYLITINNERKPLNLKTK